MKKVLFVGDAGVPSGFARATHEILDRLKDHFEVTVLAMNYRGDPVIDPKTDLPYPYAMYPAGAGGDPFGLHRLVSMCQRVHPDVIIIQQDGWYFPTYFHHLRELTPMGEYAHPEVAAIPVIGAVAVDGMNFNGAWIKDLTLAIFWTQFALDEARRGGYVGPAQVIPLGVDLDAFYPVERDGALERQKISALKGKFIVGNINRNQARKRFDLSIRYFAEWVHTHDVSDATLFLYSAPTGDQSINIVEYCRYYDIYDRIAICAPDTFFSRNDDDLRDFYNCFDVAISTTQGEGMGLTQMEAMACGVPCILPSWSALGDWAKGAAAMVPCTSTAPQSFSPICSVIGGVPDQRAFVTALDMLYRDKHHRDAVADLGRARVSEDRFRWHTIGDQWIEAVKSVVQPETIAEKIWQEV